MRYELKEITYAKPKSLIYNLFKYSLFFSSSFNIIMTPNVFLSYCPRFVVGPSLKFILLNSCSHNIMIFFKIGNKRKKKNWLQKRERKCGLRINQLQEFGRPFWNTWQFCHRVALCADFGSPPTGSASVVSRSANAADVKFVSLQEHFGNEKRDKVCKKKNTQPFSLSLLLASVSEQVCFPLFFSVICIFFVLLLSIPDNCKSFYTQSKKKLKGNGIVPIVSANYFLNFDFSKSRKKVAKLKWKKFVKLTCITL